MAKPPQFIKGVDFDEAFFDTVIKRAGGHRLLDLHTPPPKTKHVDYIVTQTALELKILTSDPLDSPERQERIAKFFKEEFPKGMLWVTATKQEAAIRGPMAKKYWEWYMGTSIQDRINSASDQIEDTHTFVPNLVGGAVLLVNTAAQSLDTLSFTHLADHYQKKFPSVSAVYCLNVVPTKMEDGRFELHFGIIGKDSFRAKADALGTLLDSAIHGEIEQRTGRAVRTTEMDMHAKPERVPLHITEKGLQLKKPLLTPHTKP